MKKNILLCVLLCFSLRGQDVENTITTLYAKYFPNGTPTINFARAFPSDQYTIQAAKELLGDVNLDITKENDIKKAYRKRTLIWHPDKYQGPQKDKATALFNLLNDASTFLVNRLSQPAQAAPQQQANCQALFQEYQNIVPRLNNLYPLDLAQTEKLYADMDTLGDKIVNVIQNRTCQFPTDFINESNNINWWDPFVKEKIEIQKLYKECEDVKGDATALSSLLARVKDKSQTTQYHNTFFVRDNWVRGAFQDLQTKITTAIQQQKASAAQPQQPQQPTEPAECKQLTDDKNRLIQRVANSWRALDAAGIKALKQEAATLVQKAQQSKCTPRHIRDVTGSIERAVFALEDKLEIMNLSNEYYTLNSASPVALLRAFLNKITNFTRKSEILWSDEFDTWLDEQLARLKARVGDRIKQAEQAEADRLTNMLKTVQQEVRKVYIATRLV